VLPIDFKFKTLSPKKQILDIGAKTISKFKEEIEKARMIVWNGPMGYYEEKKFAKGTEEVAKLVAKSRGYTVVGGGDSIACLERFHLMNKVDFVSTGGGAMLEFLAGKKLPGLKYLYAHNTKRHKS
jgi:phosphoglycerate kinase